jgi:hypothetical protein
LESVAAAVRCWGMRWYRTCGIVVQIVLVEEYSSGTGLLSRGSPARKRSARWSNMHSAEQGWNPRARGPTCSAIVWPRA